MSSLDSYLFLRHDGFHNFFLGGVITSYSIHYTKLYDAVLILVSGLIFHINWGTPLSVLLSVIAVAIPASAFGIFANTLVKNTKQSGAVYGGLLTVTGMAGMMDIFAAGSNNLLLSKISLAVPQGWSIKMIHNGISGAPSQESLLIFGITLLWSAGFILFGLPGFIKRFS